MSQVLALGSCWFLHKHESQWDTRRVPAASATPGIHHALPLFYWQGFQKIWHGPRGHITRKWQSQKLNSDPHLKFIIFFILPCLFPHSKRTCCGNKFHVVVYLNRRKPRRGNGKNVTHCLSSKPWRRKRKSTLSMGIAGIKSCGLAE